MVTGGFQTASVIRRALTDGTCDAVTIARPLIANPDLLRYFAEGKDLPDRPCTYCNRCLINVVENPLGCYEESRFPSYDAMIHDVMAFFEDDPPPDDGAPRRSGVAVIAHAEQPDELARSGGELAQAREVMQQEVAVVTDREVL
jgi:tRNA-dihydrouridine synthase